MKKIYQAPRVNLVLVQATQMLALSLGKEDEGGGVVLNKQDNGWDLWGDDNDFDN